MTRLLLFALPLAACGPITFTTSLSGEGTVPGSQLGALLGAFPSLNGLTAIDFAQNQDFQNNKTTREMVRSVKATSLVVSVVAPAAAKLDFIDSVELTLKAEGQPDVVFARKENIPQAASMPPGSAVSLELLDVDLAPWVRAKSASLVMSGRGRQPPQDTTLNVVAGLKVGASPF